MMVASTCPQCGCEWFRHERGIGVTLRSVLCERCLAKLWDAFRQTMPAYRGLRFVETESERN